MTPNYILTDYLRHALAQSVHDELEDGSFSGAHASLHRQWLLLGRLSTSVRKNFAPHWKNGWCWD